MSGHDFTERHIEVLDAALQLIAERGVHGASLRLLASRLGMSQPSLYHYFDSKDQLIEQIVTLCIGRMVEPVPYDPALVPDDLEALPALVCELVDLLYARDRRHVDFVRFLFSVSAEAPQHRARLRQAFRTQMSAAIDTFMAPWVARGEITAEDARHLAFMITRALGLGYIEHHLLADSPDPDELRRFSRFVAEAAVHTLRARRPVPQLDLASLRVAASATPRRPEPHDDD